MADIETLRMNMEKSLKAFVGEGAYLAVLNPDNDEPLFDRTLIREISIPFVSIDKDKPIYAYTMIEYSGKDFCGQFQEIKDEPEYGTRLISVLDPDDPNKPLYLLRLNPNLTEEHKKFLQSL